VDLVEFRVTSPLTMASRPRKRRNKLPSIIDSDVDRRFSPSFDESESSSDSNDTPSVTSTGSNPVPIVPVVTPRKRQRHEPKPDSTTGTAVSMKINYIIQAFSASEMKKPVSKRVARTSCLQLSPNEPLDTVQAQFLTQIDALLHPKTHVYADYQVIITIPRILGKPGLPLLSANDYTLLLERARNKSNLVHVTIVALKDSDKENDAPAETVPKSKKASRDPRMLVGTSTAR
jgi:hypothetical protein